MVQQPNSPRSPSSKNKTPGSESDLSPAWSVISGLDTEGSSCLQSSVQALQYQQRGMRNRGRAGSTSSAGSEDDLYRAAAQQP